MGLPICTYVAWAKSKFLTGQFVVTYSITYVSILTDHPHAVEFGSHTLESCHYPLHASVSYCRPLESVLHQNVE